MSRKNYSYYPLKTTAVGAQKFALSKPAGPQPILIKQRYLNEAQVAALTVSRDHYFLFLILTLPRTPVELSEIVARLPSAPVGFLMHDLETSQLASP